MAYSQNDPRWKNILLGFNTQAYANIGGYGCYITAIANVLAWDGKSYTPQQINDICKANGWFDQGGGFLNKDDIPSLIDGGIKFAGRANWNDLTPMSHFTDADDPNVIYIICIDSSPASGVQTHFVVVQGRSGNNDLIIDDSWDGVRKNLSRYGNPAVIIQSAMKFTKGADTVKVENKENWYARLNKLHIQVRGRELPRDAFTGLVGLDTLTVIEIFSDHQEANETQWAQETGVVAIRDKWADQIHGLQAQLKQVQDALANEQAKPPREVVKEVEKIVTEFVDRPVEVIKTVEVQVPLSWKTVVPWVVDQLKRLTRR